MPDYKGARPRSDEIARPWATKAYNMLMIPAG
jgi:hypothetical protein